MVLNCYLIQSQVVILVENLGERNYTEEDHVVDTQSWGRGGNVHR